jgi:hypothetical protein
VPVHHPRVLARGDTSRPGYFSDAPEHPMFASPPRSIPPHKATRSAVLLAEIWFRRDPQKKTCTTPPLQTAGLLIRSRVVNLQEKRSRRGIASASGPGFDVRATRHSERRKAVKPAKEDLSILFTGGNSSRACWIDRYRRVATSTILALVQVAPQYLCAYLNNHSILFVCSTGSH